MLLTTVLTFASLQAQATPEPKWTGEVKAFALYLQPERLSSEAALSKVFVARKVYEDGSTSTLIRAAPGFMYFQYMSEYGEARIERNAKGFPTRIARQQYTYKRDKQGRIDRSTLRVFGTKDPAVRKSERLPTGEIKLGPDDYTPFKPTKDLVMDPLEWLAFGLPGAPEGWRLPGINEHADRIGEGYLYSLGNERLTTRPFQGDQQRLIVVPMSTFGLTNRLVTHRGGKDVSITNEAYLSGELYYWPNRTLAAYIPKNTRGLLEAFTSHPSLFGGNDFLLNRKLIRGYYVPTPVSASERAALLDMV